MCNRIEMRTSAHVLRPVYVTYRDCKLTGVTIKSTEGRIKITKIKNN